MSHPARWKYLVVAVQTQKGKRYGVKERYKHGPEGDWMFLGELGEDVKPARLWIERQEQRGGYARALPGVLPDTERWKYVIVVRADRRYVVKERGKHYPEDPCLFVSEPGEASESAKLWIEQQEIVGGYALPPAGGN